MYTNSQGGTTMRSQWLAKCVQSACIGLVLAICAAAVWSQGTFGVQPEGTRVVHYRVTDLGPLPGGTYSYAYGVNDFGLVAGGSATATLTNSNGVPQPRSSGIEVSRRSISARLADRIAPIAAVKRRKPV